MLHYMYISKLTKFRLVIFHQSTEVSQCDLCRILKTKHLALLRGNSISADFCYSMVVILQWLLFECILFANIS